MSVLEKEIIEKFKQLEPDAQARVLATIASEKRGSFDYEQWWANVEEVQNSIRQRIGGKANIDALSLLDELREEAS